MPAILSPDAVQRLEGILHSEMAKLNELAALLQNEFEALSAKNGDALMTLSQEKLTLLEGLESVARHKNQLLESSGFSLSKAGLQEILAAVAQPSLTALWAGIETQLRACQKQNLVNGQLLDATRRQTQQLLAILVGEAESPTELYTAKGGTTPPSLSAHTRTKA